MNVIGCTPVAIYLVIAIFICCIGSLINMVMYQSYDITGPCCNLSSICLYSICLALICTISPMLSWGIVLLFICCNISTISAAATTLSNAKSIKPQ
ncbi:hypothetical protein QKU48_gp0166 [Fadolivirus algeromassiliense]|uniref:Uncharacterized protein n=1 Tax=Fadolivirus FV1/VV64 TaxID=3070911 RepID=A0A7D3QUK3_9VIRU|nr:hypothetical protein QKU48_gp0166 [Fadolivirus algeromassiliense]QKF93624.1 hypothetical protein Fadolivirus_1_166 [Fadolivirus FV1/VV64]